jgi:tRNA 5-methylaminomethyl-2-thiouridine biosynthesis bifunctional protein
MSSRRINPISIEFKDGKTPYSPLFQDVYYTHGTGIEESNYVYLEGSGFTDALKNGPSKKNFTVGEIGFGVGLNFLLTARHFLENAKPDQKLTYITVEKFPVLIDDLKTLYQDSTDLGDLPQELIQQYPVLVPGIHSLTFKNGRVRLLLMLGEAKEMFSNLSLPHDQRIEFWYWDGFAPNRNPEAFQDSLFQQLLSISAPAAKATSFTSAGWVRRGLQSVGYRIQKRPGYGFKRECIQVDFPELPKQESIQKPWFSAEGLKKAKREDQIAVIGAGLSGTAIARALAERGCRVTLLEQDQIAAHASGNSYGMFNVQLSKKPNPISRFSQLSLTHFLRELNSLPLPRKKGILRLDANREPEDFITAMSTSEYPETFFQQHQEGMLFPECGVLNPRKLCETRADHPNIQLIRSSVSKVIRGQNKIQLVDSQNTTIGEFDHVVYGTGASLVLDRFLKDSLLESIPLRAIRGQVIHVQPTPESKTIDHCLVDSGYSSPLAPEISGSNTHCIGATYQAKQVFPDQEQIDTETLLKEARERHPAFQSLRVDDVQFIRVGYRLSTPDKLPLIGPLCDPKKLKDHYQPLLRSGKEASSVPLPAEPGEWLFTGMGSRGITFSSYGAEILSALMFGEILPIEADLWEHVHSARFIIRSLKKP